MHVIKVGRQNTKLRITIPKQICKDLNLTSRSYVVLSKIDKDGYILKNLTPAVNETLKNKGYQRDIEDQTGKPTQPTQRKRTKPE